MAFFYAKILQTINPDCEKESLFTKSAPPPPGVPQVHGGQCGAGRRHLHREEEDPQGGQAHGRHWQDPGGGVAPLEGWAKFAKHKQFCLLGISSIDVSLTAVKHVLEG